MAGVSKSFPSTPPTARQMVRISKFLSRVLRHRPDQIGITVDAHGWARVDELIRKAEAIGFSLTPALIAEVITRSSDKKRFALSADGARIRATHGHSLAVDLGLEPARRRGSCTRSGNAGSCSVAVSMCTCRLMWRRRQR